mmetsp:Transcript_60416/g.134649  ORF Transcript_60416/g.134649 Transcript_60416/m.134649 type:complete len:166 (+) Transcript_60416:300-797(+)
MDRYASRDAMDGIRTVYMAARDAMYCMDLCVCSMVARISKCKRSQKNFPNSSTVGWKISAQTNRQLQTLQKRQQLQQPSNLQPSEGRKGHRSRREGFDGMVVGWWERSCSACAAGEYGLRSVVPVRRRHWLRPRAGVVRVFCRSHVDDAGRPLLDSVGGSHRVDC